MMVATLVSRQIVGILIIVYSIGFWRSASRLGEGPQVLYPQLVIVVLVTIIVIDLFVTVLKAVTDRLEPSVADPMKAHTEPQSDGNGDAVSAGGGSTATAEPDTLRRAMAGIRAEHHKTAVATLLTTMYIVIIPRLGFYEATALFLPALFLYLGIRRPVALMSLWIGSMAGIWLLFSLLLSVRLPGGPLF